MSGWIEIIIALLVVLTIGRFITYVTGFFSFLPLEIELLMIFAIALSIILFVIHRKD